MALVTIRNDFHNTSARVNPDRPLSAATVSRVRRELCGMADCSCGGQVGERGPQECDIDYSRERYAITPAGFQGSRIEGVIVRAAQEIF